MILNLAGGYQVREQEQGQELQRGKYNLKILFRQSLWSRVTNKAELIFLQLPWNKTAKLSDKSIDQIRNYRDWLIYPVFSFPCLFNQKINNFH